MQLLRIISLSSLTVVFIVEMVTGTARSTAGPPPSGRGGDGGGGGLFGAILKSVFAVVEDVVGDVVALGGGDGDVEDAEMTEFTTMIDVDLKEVPRPKPPPPPSSATSSGKEKYYTHGVDAGSDAVFLQPPHLRCNPEQDVCCCSDFTWFRKRDERGKTIFNPAPGQWYEVVPMGNCRSVDVHDRKSFCYLHQPSSCPDASLSSNFKGMAVTKFGCVSDPNLHSSINLIGIRPRRDTRNKKPTVSDRTVEMTATRSAEDSGAGADFGADSGGEADFGADSGGEADSGADSGGEADSDSTEIDFDFVLDVKVARSEDGGGAKLLHVAHEY